MVNIPTINGDDWGMVFDIAITTLIHVSIMVDHANN